MNIRQETALGIIGTAGRQGLHKILSLEIFLKMCRTAQSFAQDICNEAGIDNLLLVSGGAAWADHVAVKLFSEHPEKYDLQIYGPCAWDNINKKFLDNGIQGMRNWLHNPGSTTNYYHKLFKQRTGIDSLLEIDRCAESSYSYANGFYARNGLVANRVTHLIAFTFGSGGVPIDGGTKNTWDAAKNQGVVCVHKSLHTLAP